KALYHDGLDENEILALLTANPAAIMEKEDQFGKIARGMDANFLITSGVPGLEITDIGQISKVYFRGEEVVDRVKYSSCVSANGETKNNPVMQDLKGLLFIKI